MSVLAVAISFLVAIVAVGGRDTTTIGGISNEILRDFSKIKNGSLAVLEATDQAFRLVLEKVNLVVKEPGGDSTSTAFTAFTDEALVAKLDSAFRDFVEAANVLYKDLGQFSERYKSVNITEMEEATKKYQNLWKELNKQLQENKTIVQQLANLAASYEKDFNKVVSDRTDAEQALKSARTLYDRNCSKEVRESDSSMPVFVMCLELQMKKHEAEATEIMIRKVYTDREQRFANVSATLSLVREVLELNDTTIRVEEAIHLIRLSTTLHSGLSVLLEAAEKTVTTELNLTGDLNRKVIVMKNVTQEIMRAIEVLTDV